MGASTAVQTASPGNGDTTRFPGCAPTNFRAPHAIAEETAASKPGFRARALKKITNAPPELFFAHRKFSPAAKLESPRLSLLWIASKTASHAAWLASSISLTQT